MQARHDGSANVAWFDSHVQSVRLGIPSRDSGKATVQSLQANHLGYLLRNDCPMGSHCQDYFYLLKKPSVN